MSERKSTSEVLLSIGAVQVLIMGVALSRSKVLSVLLGPAGFGVTSTIDQTVLTLVNLGALSLPFTALKFMARSHGEGAEAFRQAYTSFLYVLTGLGLATVAIVLALLAARPGAFAATLAPHRAALGFAVLGVPAVMLNILFVNTLAAAQRAASGALVNLWSSFALATGAVLGQLVHGLTGLYVGTLLAGALTTVVTLRYLRRSVGVRTTSQRPALAQHLRRQPEIVSYSLLLYVAMAAYSLAMLRARYVVLSAFGEGSAGLLQAQFSLALTLGAVVTPMSSLLLTPLVNRTIPVSDKAAAAADFATRLAILLSLAAMPLVLFPRLAIAVLFSARFAPAAAALFVFLVWQCAYQFVNVYLQLLIGLDDVLYFSLITCVGYACVIGLFEALVPRLGLGGVGIALAAGVGIMGVSAAVRLRTRFAVRVTGAVVGRTLLCLGSIVAGGVSFSEYSERTPGGVLARAAYAVVVAVVFWVLLTSGERRRALRSVARVLAGGRAVRASPS